MIRRQFYEYFDKLDNVEEMGKCLETYKLPRLIHEAIKTLNKPMSKEIKSVIKTCQHRGQDQMSFPTVNFTKLVMKN